MTVWQKHKRYTRSEWIELMLEAAEAYEVEPSEVSTGMFNSYFKVKYDASEQSRHSYTAFGSWDNFKQAAQSGSGVVTNPRLSGSLFHPLAGGTTTIEEIARYNRQFEPKKPSESKNLPQYRSKRGYDKSNYIEYFKQPGIDKELVILVLGDTHMPYADMDVLRQAAEWRDDHKPDLVVQVGDFEEQKAWNKYLKSPDDYSPTLEFQKMLEQAQEMAELFPEMVILQGNHDRRRDLAVKEGKLPSQLIKSSYELFDFAPGWIFHEANEPFCVGGAGGLAFIHGDEAQGVVEKKVEKTGRSIIQGHTHKPRLVFVTDFLKESKFGMDVGCMIDLTSSAMAYAAKNLNGYWCGFGTIDCGQPGLIQKQKR